MKTRTAICSLEEALDYQNPAVVHDFRRSYATSPKETALLFEDMKRWLWLCAKIHTVGTKGVRAEIGPSLRLLDEMWHAFILHTAAYREYCTSKFGFFIEHLPTSAAPRARRRIGRESMASTKSRMRRNYSFIYDHLGEETLQRWYGDWSSTVTTRYLRDLLVKHSR